MRTEVRTDVRTNVRTIRLGNDDTGEESRRRKKVEGGDVKVTWR